MTDDIAALQRARAALLLAQSACVAAGIDLADPMLRHAPNATAELVRRIDAHVASLARRAQPLALGGEVETINSRGTRTMRKVVAVGPKYIRLDPPMKCRIFDGVSDDGGYWHIQPDDLARIWKCLRRKAKP